jgi:N-acetylmuramoyl-L-alanine amidase/SH3-like domain-containing protein
MKKAISFVLALVLSSGLLTINAASKQVITVYQETNFRQSNTIDSAKVAVIKPPASFDVLETSKNKNGETWLKVKLSSGKFAWVSAAVVNISTINEETKISNQSLVLDASINKINIRSGPSKSTSVVRTLNAIETFRIVSKVSSSDGSTWYKINLGGNVYGWVLSTVVSNFITDQIKSEPVKEKVAIIDALVNIRSAPSLESALVTRTTSVIKPKIINQSKDKDGKIWYEIVLPNGNHGWVRSDMARIDRPATETPKKGLQAIISPGTNIRSNAGVNEQKLVTIDKNFELPVLASKPDVNGAIWYKVSGDFGTGWVMASLVETSSSLSYPTTNAQSYLRVAPSVNAKIVTYTDVAYRCTVSGSALTNKNERWYLITLVEPNKTGWIISDNIKLVGNVSLPPSNLIGTSVQIRKETKLTSIPAGNDGEPIYSGGIGTVDAVALRDKGQLYYKITSGKNTGWVSGDYLKKSEKKSLEQAKITSFEYVPIDNMIIFKFIYSGYPQDIRVEEKPNDSLIQLYIENSISTTAQPYKQITSTLVNSATITQVSVSPAIVKVTFDTNKQVETYLEPLKSGVNQIVLKIYPRSADSVTKVLIQNKPVISSILPYYKDAKPMVPLAGIKETLGYLLTEDTTKTEYTLKVSDSKQLKIRMGDPQVNKIINNIKTTFLVTPAAEKKNGNVFIPIESFASVLGFKYDFVQKSRTIYLDPIIEQLDFGGCANKTAGCDVFSTEIKFMQFYKRDIQPDGRNIVTISNAVLGDAATKNIDKKRVDVKYEPRVGDKAPTVTLLITINENETLDVTEAKNPNRLIFMIKQKGQSGIKDKVIYLDPGHGSYWPGDVHDDGCKGKNGLVESSVCLSVLLKLKDKLQADGAKVILTRTDDTNKTNPDLDKRVSLANNSGADMFISLHLGYSMDKSENGCKTYYYTQKGKDLAQTIQNFVTRAVPGDNMGTQQSGFNVCKSISGMPSVILEPMHLSNENGENWLNQDNNTSNLAQAICDAITKYFEELSN